MYVGGPFSCNQIISLDVIIIENKYLLKIISLNYIYMHIYIYIYIWIFIWTSLVAQTVKRLSTMWETWV